ncbi:MAG: SRPBCC domain-containing protein [Desulfomicrobium escambiense]|nr:SRPBCC domain-containing protein [Desulfomicrobium escambiense]
MVIEESIEILAPLQVVWGVFSAFENWKNWNTVCQSCCIVRGGEMSGGTCFQFTLRPYYLPIKVTPVIVKCEPTREVVWAGSRFGVHAEHSFTFVERDGKVIITSIETFRGFMLWVSRLIFIPRKLHRLTQQLLRQIKEHSESCAGGSAV